MAISKLLCMKDSGDNFHGRHLKRAIEYICKSEKTQNKRLISAVNCQVESAYKQMIATKQNYGKIDKRQGYHIVISFEGQEVTPDTAFEITYKFVEEYLSHKYEVIFAVHDNTENVHSHIVFNSVSFADGKKYHYQKGDWEKDILPIVNKLCKEYGISVLDVDKQREKSKKLRNNNNYDNENKTFSKMIKRDIDTCCIYATTFEKFVELLKYKGYEIKYGKYLAIKPLGMNRFRRCKTLGEGYTEEDIINRIANEDISNVVTSNDISKVSPKIVKCYVKRYKRAKLSGLQKKYFRKLYQTGKLKKKSYSQAWKYKDDIRKMNTFQQQYLFLAKYDIYNMSQLIETVQIITKKKNDLSIYKRKIYKERANFKSVFRILEDMENLASEEKAFQNGDNFFHEEHKQWIKLEKQLQSECYSFEELRELKEFYKEKLFFIRKNEKNVTKELSIGKSIFKDISDMKESIKRDIKKDEEKAIEKSMDRQL